MRHHHLLSQSRPQLVVVIQVLPERCKVPAQEVDHSTQDPLKMRTDGVMKASTIKEKLDDMVADVAEALELEGEVASLDYFEEPFGIVEDSRQLGGIGHVCGR